MTVELHKSKIVRHGSEVKYVDSSIGLKVFYNKIEEGEMLRIDILGDFSQCFLIAIINRRWSYTFRYSDIWKDHDTREGVDDNIFDVFVYNCQNDQVKNFIKEFRKEVE
jgi:deoxyhypusine synthase